MSRQYSHAQGRPRRWLHRDLRNSTIDGLFYSIMTGLVDFSLPVFALWLLKSHPHRIAAAGLIQTIPIAIGCIVGLATPILTRRLKGYRLVTAIYASSQAVMCIPLAAIALQRDQTSSPLLFLFLFATLYTIGSYAGGSAWNSWSGCFTPPSVRTHYTARRNFILQTGLLAGVSLSGILLHLAESASPQSLPAWLPAGDQLIDRAFALLFLTGAICRVVSAFYIVKVPDAQAFAAQEKGLTLKELFARIVNSSAGRFLLFVAAAQFSVQFASAHWHGFAKSWVGFDYSHYFALHATMFVGKIGFNFVAGTISKSIGTRGTGVLAMLILAPVPILWLLAGDNFPVMFIAQLIAGAGLATFELAIYLLQLDTTHPQERTSLISKLMLTNNSAGFLGSAMGSQTLVFISGITGFAVIFISAAVLRAASALILRTPAKSNRPV